MSCFSSTTRSSRRRAHFSSGYFSNRDHRLWPGQRSVPPAARHPQGRLDRRRLSRAAGPERRLCLRGEAEPDGGAPPSPRRAGQRRAGADRSGPEIGRCRRDRRTVPAQEGSQVQELHGKAAREADLQALCRTRCHEFLRALHLTADRSRPADGRPAAVRPCGLSCFRSGRCPTSTSRPFRSRRSCPAPIRRPSHRLLFHAPGTATEPNPGRHATDLIERARCGSADRASSSSRTVDSAAVDVLSAINAASPYLPPNIPSPPTIRKVNPAETPIMLIALSSKIRFR